MGITTTRYVLDPAAGLTQVLADGTNTYLYGNARIGQYQASMQYFGADGLGSVRQIYDVSAEVVGSTRYDPYGSLMSQGGATSVFAFAGEQYDAGTGLEYLRARYYSAAQGRFTTRDAWEGDPNAPMSYNAWNYTNGDPVNLTDPSGHDPYWCDTQLDPQGCRAQYLYKYWRSSHPGNPITDYIDSSCLDSKWVLYLLRQSPVCKGKTGQELLNCESTSQNAYNKMIITAVYERFGLSEVFHVSRMVKRMIARESQFDPNNGVGTTKGKGLMAITGDAREMVMSRFGGDFTKGINVFNAEQNIRAGVAYLKILQDSVIEQDIKHQWSTTRAELWKFTVTGYTEQGMWCEEGGTCVRALRLKAQQEKKRDPTLWSSIEDLVDAKVSEYVNYVFSGFDQNPVPLNPSP